MLSMSSGVVRPPTTGLHDHVVLLGVALVARDVAPAQHGLDGAGHRVHAHAQVGGALAVDLDAQLGLVQPQVRCRAAGSRGSWRSRPGNWRTTWFRFW
jgi:hypothetical protein